MLLGGFGDKMREAAIFLIIFVVLVTLLAGVVRLLGGSFGLDLVDSWFLSLVALALVAPGVLNIHIFASPHTRASATRKLLALIRGVGMLTAATACTIPVLTTIKRHSVFVWGIGLGLLMNFGTLPLEHLLDRQERNR